MSRRYPSTIHFRSLTHRPQTEQPFTDLSHLLISYILWDSHVNEVFKPPIRNNPKPEASMIIHKLLHKLILMPQNCQKTTTGGAIYKFSCTQTHPHNMQVKAFDPIKQHHQHPTQEQKIGYWEWASQTPTLITGSGSEPQQHPLQ